MTIPDHLITPLDWSAEALRHAAAWTGQPEGARALVESKRYLAMHEQIERLRAEWQASERRAIEFGDILAQYIAAMRAAVLDEEDGMEWIRNTLAGPGHLPAGLGEHATAQAMFDAEVAEIEAHRAKHPIPEPVVGPLRAQIRTLIAERDAALAELARVQARGWPSTPEDVRALLGSRCGAVRYALPVLDGESEPPPDISDTYTVSAHDLITCNIAASELRYAADVELERVRAALAQAREVRSGGIVVDPAKVAGALDEVGSEVRRRSWVTASSVAIGEVDGVVYVVQALREDEAEDQGCGDVPARFAGAISALAAKGK